VSGLEIALVLGGLAAFAGAAVGMLALGGWDAADLGFSPPSGQRLTIGAYLLASHAVTAATLWQAPKIGSCLAAGLGAGWLGAAAAGADGEHFAFLGLFLGGVGDDDPALGGRLFFHALHQHAVAEGTKVHLELRSESSFHGTKHPWPRALAAGVREC
jgi:hypothetical protein